MFGNIFNENNMVLKFFGRMGDLMVLNVLWLVSSLPLVTLGASTTALYYTTLKLVRGEEAYLGRMFFHSFRQNWKQGTLLELLFLLIGGFFGLDIQIVRTMDGTAGKGLLLLLLVFGCLFLMTVSYAFPLLAQFENTLKGTLKNAFFLSVWHLPYTAVIVVLNLIPLLLFLLFPTGFLMSAILWVVLGFAVLAYANTHLFVRIFKRYMPETEEGLE